MHRIVPLLVLCSLVLFGCYQPPTIDSPRAAVDSLIRLLLDRDVVIRRTAAEALGKIGDPQAIPGLIAVLDDSMAIVREAAAVSLGQLGALDRAAGERLVGLLADPAPLVRAGASHALASLDMGNELSLMLLPYLAHEDPDVRRVAALALEGAESSEVRQALRNMLDNPDPRLRRASVIALAESRAPQVVALLRARLASDGSSDVRAETAYRLQFLSASEVAEELVLVARQDESLQVRRWADQTLRELEAGHGFDSMRQPVLPVVPGSFHRYP